MSEENTNRNGDTPKEMTPNKSGAFRFDPNTVRKAANIAGRGAVGARKAAKAAKKKFIAASAPGLEWITIIVFRFLGIMMILSGILLQDIMSDFIGHSSRARGYSLWPVIWGIILAAICFAISELIALLRRIAKSNEQLVDINGRLLNRYEKLVKLMENETEEE